MKVQVLISTINPNPKSLIEKMNLQTDAIIVCQCDTNKYEEVIYKDKKIQIYYFNERGVALSRNTGLQRATAEIILFADDDECFVDNYEQLILEQFEKYSKYDMLLFNITYKNKKLFSDKEKIIRKYNCLKYGTICVAVKREKVFARNIHFCLPFGPGSTYGSGEDSIFIYDCLNSKMKAHSVSKSIAILEESESTWFNGYNEKYYFDKGALFKKLHKSLADIFCIIYIVRHRKEKTKLSIYERFMLMHKGVLEYKKY